MNRPCALAGTVALVGLLISPAQATPILEQSLIATGGDVMVTFVSNSAGYTSELFLDGPVGEALGAIFDSGTTQLGASANLGSFAAGTELVFKLFVQSGDTFYTGNASRNPDGLVHAVVDDLAGRVVVGFEDLYGGGDLDYNDLVFAFINLVPGDTSGTTPGGAPAVPAEVDEPATLLLLGSGLMMIVVAMKRRAV